MCGINAFGYLCDFCTQIGNVRRYFAVGGFYVVNCLADISNIRGHGRQLCRVPGVVFVDRPPEGKGGKP